MSGIGRKLIALIQHCPALHEIPCDSNSRRLSSIALETKIEKEKEKLSQRKLNTVRQNRIHFQPHWQNSQQENSMKKTLLTTLAIVSSLSISGVVFPASAHAQTQDQTVLAVGSRASATAPQQNFTGSVRVDPAFTTKAPQRVYGAYVTFEAGARTKWHTHPLGQTLIVTSGLGLTQQWGKPIQAIRPGDVVLCPPNVKHWHGAAPNVAMTHLAIGEQLEGNSVTWMESVTDEQYNAK